MSQDHKDGNHRDHLSKAKPRRDLWPSFDAQSFLSEELWKQLRPDEKTALESMSELAFIFAGEVLTEHDLQLACASRLERFFGRKFTVK